MRKISMSRPVFGVTAMLMTVMGGCFVEKESIILDKLETVAAADLDSLCSDTAMKEVSDSAHYEITNFESFPRTSLSHKATVEYYLFDDLDVVVRMKYMYHSRFRKWERFYSKYHFTPDSLSNIN